MAFRSNAAGKQLQHALSHSSQLGQHLWWLQVAERSGSLI
jgi:hypothetical protein